MITVLDGTKEYDDIWDKVYTALGFNPSCKYRGHSLDVTLPFTINVSYEIYAIEFMMEDEIEKMDEIIRDCLIRSSDKEWYALDWLHSAFRFNPRNKDEMKSLWIKDNNYYGGGYFAYFPSFYPDGDYYFFIDSKFENGYLGHPWRQEVWVFGKPLINEINKIADKLNWKKLKSEIF